MPTSAAASWVKTSLHAKRLPDDLHGIPPAIDKAIVPGRTDNGGKERPGRVLMALCTGHGRSL
jgi:hypothetical protein